MILFLTNADTELLSLRTLSEGLPQGFPDLRAANPHLLARQPDMTGVDVVVLRLLGGRRAWEDEVGLLSESCRQKGIPFLAFGGEAVLDVDLAAISTVDGSVLVKAFEYLVQGGPSNLEQLLRFVADTVLQHRFGFVPPVRIPDHGVFGDRQRRAGLPTIGVVFYRAHLVAGNTRFVEELCDAIEVAGANAIPVYCYSLRASRDEESPVVGLLRESGIDAVITTVLAAGSQSAVADAWEPGSMASLDVPVVQAMCATGTSAEWSASTRGLGPVDVAMSVAIPEFDGRVVSVPFSFKEEVDRGDDLGATVNAYRTLHDRTERVAGLAVALARLRSIAPADRKVALVLSAYPTRRSRLGNAVGLDTPASVIELLSAMTKAGYRVDRIPFSGDELMAELADSLVYEDTELSAGAIPVGRLGATMYKAWFATLPEEARLLVEGSWGPPPGSVYVDRSGVDHGGVDHSELVFSGMDLGGVLVAVQPPRGFGEDPVAVYHSPDLPPTHHYLGFYRWIEEVWGAHALVHVGKHGTLEWLPGKGVGLSSECFPDAALGSLPLVYPFVVNDPGEGTQAKRRSHAIVVDHLVPPLTRADTYDDLSRLEGLLDQHAQLAALDPSKLPGIRKQVWETLVDAEIHRDLGLAGESGGSRPVPSFEDESFDDLLLEVDGYLCELKDAQIRGGLHILGIPPSDQAEVEMVAAITRLPQPGVAALRQEVAEELGVSIEPGVTRRADLDRVEEECVRRLGACQRAGWDIDAVDANDLVEVTPALRWACEWLVPALRASDREIESVLKALDGRFIDPGPSGAPSRGMAHVLPTGRNFYSIDPKAIPSPLAWEVGVSLADRLVERHIREEGRPPVSVALVVWGTSAMRTGGDDVAEALALLGVRPLWAEGTGRVCGLELIPLRDLGRPRVDVTLRVSGFFRDAFPHVLDLLDDALSLVANAEGESPNMNPVRSAGLADPRVFGPKPGAYGSGILNVIESGDWRDEADLAAVYLAWGGWAYGRDGTVTKAPEAFRRRLIAVEVAVKNQDNREHDIFDSDDYFQDHGGMIAAIRTLSGRQPKAWFGDSADPSHPRVRSLAEEAARVVRSRVLNPKWLAAMERHGYKGAFEMAATVDYLFGYDATAGIIEDWMYERVTEAYVGDPGRRKFFQESNPWALRAIAERLLEAAERDLWSASPEALRTLRSAVLEAEGWEEGR